MKRIVLLVVLILCLPMIPAAPPALTFSLAAQNERVAISYTVTGNGWCYLEWYLNDQNTPFSERELQNCNQEGTVTFPQQATKNEVYAKIMYGENNEVYIAPKQSLESPPPIAGPPQAANLQLMMQGAELPALAPGVVYTVDVKFQITATSLSSVTLDLADFSLDPFVQESLQSIPLNVAEQCTKVGAMYSCTLPGRQLVTNDALLRIGLTIIDDTGTTTQTLEKTFTLSDGKPEITFLGTDTCQDNVCYVKNGNNVIVIRTTGSSIGFQNLKNMYYAVSSTPYKVTSCTGGDCTGNLPLSCNDGAITLTITSYASPSGIIPSSDDAGNPVRGITRETLQCDNTAPVLHQIELTRDSGMNFSKTGDSISITANITETTTPMMYVNFSEFGGNYQQATCTKKQTAWECTATGTVAKPGAYTASYTVDVFDIVRNTQRVQQSEKVYQVDAQQKPNFWDVSNTMYSPKTFNKKHLPNSDNVIYYYAKLTPKTGQAKIRIIKEGSCTPIQGKGLSGLMDMHLMTQYSKNNDLVLTMKLKKSADYSTLTELEYLCTFDIYSSLGNIYYTIPEQENLTVKITLKTQADVGDNLQTEIQQIKNDAQASLDRWTKTENYLKTAQAICLAMGGSESASIAISNAASVTEFIPGLQGTSQGLLKTDKGLTKVNTQLAKIPYGLQMCRFATCDAPIQKAIPKLLGDLPGVDTAAKITGNGNLSYESLFDPYRSYYTARMSLCLPAIIQIEKRDQAISCEYARCLSQDVKAGFPIEQCKAAKSYAECKYKFGDLFEIIPYTAMQRRLGTQVQQIISDPVTFVGTVGWGIICDKIPSASTYAICRVPKALNAINSLQTLFSKWIDMGKKSTDGYCGIVLPNIDDQGYWVPVDMNQDEFKTPVQPYQDGKITCDGLRGCYFTDDPKTSVRMIDSKIDDAQLIVDGEYRGPVSYHNEQFKEYGLQDVGQQQTPGSPGTVDPAGTQKPIGQTDFQIDKTRVDKAFQQAFPGVNWGADALIKDPDGNLIVNPKYTNLLNLLETYGYPPSSAGIQQALNDRMILAYYSDKYTKNIFGPGVPGYENFEEYFDASQEYQNTYTDKMASNGDLTNEIQESDTNIALWNRQNQQADANIVLWNSLKNPDPNNAQGTVINIYGDDGHLQNVEYTPDYFATHPGEIDKLIQKAQQQKQDNLDKIQKAQQQKKDNQKTIDQNNKDIAKSEKVKNDAFEKARKQSDVDQRVARQGWAAWSDYLEIGRAVHYVTTLVPGYKSVWPQYTNFMRNLFEKDVMQFAVGDYESAICENRPSKESSQTGYAFLNSGTLQRSAVHIEGERSPLITSPEGSYYNYYITAGVTSKKTGLKFYVFVDGAGQQLLTDTIELTDEKPSYSASDSALITFNATKQFTRVCINFLQSESDLRNIYFDQLDTQGQSSRICNSIKLQ